MGKAFYNQPNPTGQTTMVGCVAPYTVLQKHPVVYNIDHRVCLIVTSFATHLPYLRNILRVFSVCKSMVSHGHLIQMQLHLILL